MKAKHQPLLPTAEELNFIPFLDILLVLLMIFMATTPSITQSVQVELPGTTIPAQELSEEESLPLIVEVGPSEFATIDGQERSSFADLHALSIELQAWRSLYPRRNIVVAGERSIPYERVTWILRALQTLGIREVGLMLEQENR